MARMSQTHKLTDAEKARLPAIPASPSQQPTQTIKDVLSDAVKSPSQEAIAEYNKKQALKNTTALTDPVLSNAQANLYAEDAEINAMLTRAGEFGISLDNHAEYQAGASEIARAKEVDDYKAIAFLKYIETYLSSAQLAYLPWPGMTKSEADAKNIRNTASNESPLLFDKPVNSGGRAKVETFYGKMIKSTKLGQEAQEILDELDKEEARAKLAPGEARDHGNFLADKSSATRRLNNLVSALRTAAHVYLLIKDIKKRMPHIEIEWIREPTTTEIPEGSDLTMLNIPEAGEVVHSTQCLMIYSTKGYASLAQAVKKARPFSLGSFKRWKPDRAIEKASKRLNAPNVTVDDLIDSAKAPPQAPAPGSVSKARDVKNATEAGENLNAVLNYLHKDPANENARNAEWKGNYAVDDVLYTRYKLFVQLRADFDGTPGLEAKAKEIVAKKDAK